jgi:hypothetical protein
MRTAAAITLCSAFVALGSVAHAEEGLEPELRPLSGAHASVAVETSAGDGGGAVGFRGAMSYDVLHGNGDSLRPALGVGATLGGTGRDVQMSSKGIWDVGAMITASLRFHTVGVLVDRRLFASAALLSDFGPMSTEAGARFSIGGNWFAAAAEHHNAWLLILPQQLEVYYQRQLGDHRYGLAIAYGF